jgi:hypothetical protein
MQENLLSFATGEGNSFLALRMGRKLPASLACWRLEGWYPSGRLRI